MEKSSFFNSVAGDRKYQASDFADYFNSLITNGVFLNPSTNLQVIANNDMTVTIKAGKAWINGYVYINDSDLILPITVADGILKRIDRIVIQFNTINRNITAKVKKGTFASTPVVLTLQRDADAYELGIADILINNGATSISQANITDLRLNTVYCGDVNSLIQADTTAIFNQYQDWFTSQSGTYNTQMTDNEAQFQSDFDTWFATVQNALDGDTAGNLLNLINSNSAEIGDLSLIAETDLVAAIQNDRSSLADSSTQLATGTATAITLAITTLTDLFTKTFIVSADNGGVATTINTKPLYKPNTVIAPNLTSGKAVTVWYNLASDCFFIKASATGDALVGDVLAPKTFSNGDDTDLVGTLALTGTAIASDVLLGKTIYNTNAKTKVTGTKNLSNLISSNIKNSVNIGGVVGTLATLVAGDMVVAVCSSTTDQVVGYKKKQEIRFDYTGTVRVKFSFYKTSGTAGKAQIYINGIARGIERTTITTSTTYTEDFSVIGGDLVQLYTYVNTTTYALTINTGLSVNVAEIAVLIQQY